MKEYYSISIRIMKEDKIQIENLRKKKVSQLDILRQGLLAYKRKGK